MTAYENIELPLIYQKIGMKERNERVREALSLVGLEEDDNIEAVAPVVTTTETVKSGSTTYSTSIIGVTSSTTFYVSAISEDKVTNVENTLNMFLLKTIRDEDGFSVYNESEVLDTMDDVTNTLSLMLGGIAAISLLVGGIGIMNIMLVSVTERTREIGIRKAIGATETNILSQFLIEACVLSVLGGIIGIFCSVGGVAVYNMIADASVSIVWLVALGTIVFTGVIGIIFGGYPAAKAARLLPIEALRYN